MADKRTGFTEQILHSVDLAHECVGVYGCAWCVGVTVCIVNVSTDARCNIDTGYFSLQWFSRET